MPSSDSGAPLWVLAGLGLVSVLLSWLVVSPTIHLDDPFIGLRYARNLVEGNGLVFNPGAYVEGYTAYFWIMVAALGMALGVEPLFFWQVGLTLAQLAMLWMVWLMGQQPGRPRWYALVAPALFATHLACAAWPMMGMETSFFAMATTLAVFMMEREVHQSRRGAAWLGGVMFLMCLTRFDGMILVGILFAYELLVQRSLRRVIPTIVVLAVGFAAYHGWRLIYYGDLLPNTFYAKSRALPDQLADGVNYLRHFATWGGPYVLLVLALPLAFRRATATMKLASWVAVLHLSYVGAVGGDWMSYFRFVLPVLPVLCLLVQESLWALLPVGEGREGTGVAAKIVAGAAVAVLVAWNLVPLLRSEFVEEREKSPYWSAPDAKRIGLFLDEELRPESLVALEWAGIIPFYLRQPVLDIFGLSDKAIIDSPDPDFVRTEMGVGITPEYLVERNPEVIVFCARFFDTKAEAAVGVDCRVPLGSKNNLFYRAMRDRPEYQQVITEVVEVDGKGDERRQWYPLLVRTGSPLIEKLRN